MITPNQGNIDGSILLSLVERIEKLQEEASAIASDIKAVFDEAKLQGFDPKYIREMIKLRKMDADELDEQEELMAMYRNALGI